MVELRGRFAAERRTGGVVRRDEDVCVQVHKKFVSVVCTALFVCCSFFGFVFGINTKNIQNNLKGKNHMGLCRSETN